MPAFPGITQVQLLDANVVPAWPTWPASVVWHGTARDSWLTTPRSN
jgi:hypothetical protein